MSCLRKDIQIELFPGKTRNERLSHSKNILHGEKRMFIFFMAFICTTFTAFLAILLLLKYANQHITQIYQVPSHWTVLLTRFICASIFHFFAMNDVTFACVTLKYIAMHKENFRVNRLEPAIFMLLKLGTCVFVEIVNLLVLLSKTTHKDCIENFMALAVMLSFDQLFFKVLPAADRLAFLEEKQLPFLNFVRAKIGVKVEKRPPTPTTPKSSKEEEGSAAKLIEQEG